MRNFTLSIRNSTLLGVLLGGLAPWVLASEWTIDPHVVAAGKSASVTVTGLAGARVWLEPGGPHVQGALALPGRMIREFEPQRALAYSSDGRVLEVLDLAAGGTVIGRYETAAPITAMRQSAAGLLLVLENHAVAVVDTADARRPELLREIALPEATFGVALLGNHLLQAAGAGGLVVWDVANAGAPRLAARYAASGPVLDVATTEGRAFVALDTAGLLILDMHDPAQPRWLGSHARLGAAARVAAEGDSAWIATRDGRVARIDVFNAAQPSYAGACMVTPGLTAVASLGREAWVAASGGMARLDFSAEPPPVTNDGLDAGRGVNFGGQRRADLKGDTLYVADWFSGLHIYDVGGQPRLLASLRTPGSAKGVAVRGEIAYVADDDHGLQIVDIHDPHAPRIIANLRTPGLAYTPRVAGDFLYLAGHRGGFQVIDITAPAAPRLVAEVQTPGMAWSIAVENDRAYVAADTAGLLIYDVSDPAHPRALGAFAGGGRLEDLVVRGNIAYLAFFDTGFKVLDVSDPVQPRLLSELATPGNARGLDLSGDRLYIADWLAGVHEIDIRDPRHPMVTDTCDTPGAAWGLRVQGKRSFVLDWWGGLAVIDFSKATTGRLVRYAERAVITAVVARDDALYAAYDDGSLQAFDIENALNPIWETAVELSRPIKAMALGHRTVYGALQGGGIAVLETGGSFGIRLAMELATPLEVRSLQRAGNRLYAGSEQSTLTFDVTDPLQPRPLGVWEGAIVWAGDRRIYTRGPTRNRTPDGVMSIDLPSTTQRALVQGKVIVAVENREIRSEIRDTQGSGDTEIREIRDTHGLGEIRDGGEIREEIRDTQGRLVIYRVARGAAMENGRLDMAQPIYDIAGDENAFYMSTPGSVVTVDVSDPARPAEGAHYTLNTAVGAMVYHRGTLYLAGDTQPIAIRPLPPLRARVDVHGKAEIALPGDLPAGGYDLEHIGPDRQRGVRTNALTVAQPRFSKPKITPEEFQRLLRRYRADNPLPSMGDASPDRAH